MASHESHAYTGIEAGFLASEGIRIYRNRKRGWQADLHGDPYVIDALFVPCILDPCDRRFADRVEQAGEGGRHCRYFKPTEEARFARLRLGFLVRSMRCVIFSTWPRLRYSLRICSSILSR